MTIGIEAERANNPRKTGVEHYAKQLILHLAKLDAANSYVLYLRNEPEPWFLQLPKNFKIKIIPFPFFWTQLRLSYELWQHPVDVLFIPASALPIIHPKNSVVTIHDLAWEYFPDTFTGFDRNFLRLSTWYAVRSARKIIAVSESTKQDLRRFYHVPEQKLEVIYHGYEDNRQLAELAGTELLRRLGSKYVLFISTLQPRKNLQGLIEAFKILRQHGGIEHKLAVVGREGWRYENILKSITDNSDFVVYFNHVPDGQRLSIIKNAELLVLPSFYEGFGMQILEAFAAGVPVACSNVSSMPEIAKDAAVYFDPGKPETIAKAVSDVLSQPGLRVRLRQKGQERLKNFGWEKTAQKTLELFNSLS